MVRLPSLILLGACVLAAPAQAGERRKTVAVPATRLDAAILQLGRQTGASIGVTDRSLTGVKVRRISGKLSTGEALNAMLEGTPARARLVAADTWLIERRAFVAAPPPPRRLPPVQTAALDPSLPVPEIIVTATKRDTPLLRYAGTAQVTDGKSITLADAGRGTEALQARIASLASTHLGPGRNKLFIRGIADSSFTGPTQSTVGQYWGDTRITYSAPDPSLSLYDVRSVEVLEGPQGTLYGAGSLGGIIRIVPEGPNLSAFGSRVWGGLEAVQHGEPGGDLGGLINVPIVEDQVGLRLLGYGRLDGGYIDDRLRGEHDVNQVRTFGGRATLRIAPGDGWTIDLTATGQSIEGDDAQYADRSGDGLTRASDVSQPFRNDYVLAGITIRKRWDALELVSSTALVDQYVAERFDATLKPGLATDSFYSVLAPTTPGAFSQESRIRMVTSETRLSASHADGSGWVIGASLLTNSARLNRTLGAAGLPMPVAGVRNRVDEGTLFGEATLVPLDWLSITGGARLTHSRLSGSAEDAPQSVSFRLDPGAQASRKETRLLPSVAAIARPLDGLSLFARYQQGFRPGGLAVDRDVVQRFKGDRTSTAELGARAWGRPGDRFGLTLTAAYTRWNDIQADLVDGFGFPTTANIGDGRVYSLGLAAVWRPVPGLAIDGAIYLNDSEVTSPSQLLVNALEAQRSFVLASPALGVASASMKSIAEASRGDLPNVAGTSARLGFSYSTILFERHPFNVQGFARYMGSSRLGIGPILGREQGDYLDTGLEFRLGDERRGLSLSLTNLLDARGNRFALGSPFLVQDGDFITPLRPRTIRLGFDAAF